MPDKPPPAVQLSHRCRVHPEMEIRIKQKQVYDVLSHWVNMSLLSADAPPVKVVYFTEDLSANEWVIRTKLEDLTDE